MRDTWPQPHRIWERAGFGIGKREVTLDFSSADGFLFLRWESDSCHESWDRLCGGFGRIICRLKKTKPMLKYRVRKSQRINGTKNFNVVYFESVALNRLWRRNNLFVQKSIVNLPKYITPILHVCYILHISIRQRNFCEQWNKRA